MDTVFEFYHASCVELCDVLKYEIYVWNGFASVFTGRGAFWIEPAVFQNSSFFIIINFVTNSHILVS